MIIKQLTLRLKKLMEEKTSVFWVDLGYRLRNWKRVPLQGSREVIDIPSCSCPCSYLCILYMLPNLLYMLPDYLAIGSGSVLGVWVVVPGMYGTLLKYRQYLQPISFNKHKTLIDMCNSHSMGCVYCMWQLVFADIINNNKLSIMYCDWLCLPYACILCCTPDDTHNLIGYLILLLTVFITVHICYCVLWSDCFIFIM